MSGGMARRGRERGRRDGLWGKAVSYASLLGVDEEGTRAQVMCTWMQSLRRIQTQIQPTLSLVSGAMKMLSFILMR